MITEKNNSTDILNIPDSWQSINWKAVERHVFRLQKRMYRASKSGDVKRVHSLQKLLIASFHAKLLAIRKVTQENQGKKIAGIDGVKSLTPKQRLDMIEELILTGKCKPVRRVIIPKPNGEQISLGIPCIIDIAKQYLVKLALEPQWEAKFEPHSYGFRPARSVHDAIIKIHNTINQQPKYVLNANIVKCFDRINHDKLLDKLESFPTLEREIRAWLKSGFMNGKELFPSQEGTPQGSVISPLLANIALHGMEIELKNLARTRKYEESLNIIRYADDFVVLHKDIEKIIQCKEVLNNWLRDLGLELNPSKTRISHTLEEYEGNVGFDFLGFNIRQYRVGKTHSRTNSNGILLGFKTIIKPSKENIKAHIKETGDIVRKHKSSPQAELIKELNPVILGWSNYYSAVCSKDTYSKCDYILYLQLKRWAKRRHPNKNKTWVAKKYWHSHGNNNWVFSTPDGTKLLTHAQTPIVKHVKVEGDKSFFDGDWVYWSSRLGKYPEIPTKLSTLLKNQKGKCNHCGLYFKMEDLMEIAHIIPKSLGGDDSYQNLQVLHKHCHDQKSANDGSSPRTCDKGFVEEEP